MDLSTVIVSYNVRDQLAECLESVYASAAPLRHEVFVIDNASADRSAEMVAARFPAVRLIRNPDNRGFAHACNQGLGLASGRHLLLLNPDSLVVGDCLPWMVAFMDRESWYGAATCRTWLDPACQWVATNFYSTHRWLETVLGSHLAARSLPFAQLRHRCWRRRWEAWQRQEPFAIEGIVGAFFLVRRAVMERVGGLDEQFFMYYEDMDWSVRIRRAGWALALVPGAELVHQMGQSSQEDTDKRRLSQVARESRRRYLVKHCGRALATGIRIVQRLDALAGRCAERSSTSAAEGVASGFWEGQGQQGPLTWAPIPGATRYLVECSVDAGFGWTTGRFVDTIGVELPAEQLRQAGVSDFFWRVVPFRGADPWLPWTRERGA